MAAKTGKDEHLYGIGAVAKLTGLTDHTIRVWERRYGAVVAQRAANGRRFYDPADVEKLGLLKRLTDQGLSIGQIAGETTDQLRERVQSLTEFASAPVPDHVAVAVLGDFVPNQIAMHRHVLAPVDIVIADDNRDRFVADLAQQRVDAVVLESPVLDSGVLTRMREYMAQAGARRGVIVYSFGRARDVESSRDSQIVVLRAPVNVDDVRAAILRAYSAAPAGDSALPKPRVDAEAEFTGPVAPRRFSNLQLTRLAQASTTIDCECPRHLAQLVGDLTAFEVYSANCTNRDDKDAALHRYLHKTTAQARALIEVALARVAEAEGIEY